MSNVETQITKMYLDKDNDKVPKIYLDKDKRYIYLKLPR